VGEDRWIVEEKTGRRKGGEEDRADTSMNRIGEKKTESAIEVGGSQRLVNFSHRNCKYLRHEVREE